MNLPEDVIVDLLPSYFAGEASPASRAIVDAYFDAHPRFAKAMRATQDPQDSLLELPDIAAADGGKEAIRRVRKHLKWRAALLALAIFCSVSPFTFMVENGSLTYFMWRDAPLRSLGYASVAAIAWFALWMMDRANRAS